MVAGGASAGGKGFPREEKMASRRTACFPWGKRRARLPVAERRAGVSAWPSGLFSIWFHLVDSELPPGQVHMQAKELYDEYMITSMVAGFDRSRSTPLGAPACAARAARTISTASAASPCAMPATVIRR
jgi:hypothetical protein